MGLGVLCWLVECFRGFMGMRLLGLLTEVSGLRDDRATSKGSTHNLPPF